MNRENVLFSLEKKLFFDKESIKKLIIFEDSLLKFNKKYNLISKSTEKDIWNRHILDSAQIIKFIDPVTKKIADLGSGAGFPGLIISIYDLKNKFHVKLYEKSLVKRQFLRDMAIKLNLKVEILGNVYEEEIKVDLIVSRAFKKLSEIIKISRENYTKPHKLIILKGKNAEEELNNISLDKNYSYKLIKSITNSDSKIIILEVKV